METKKQYTGWASFWENFFEALVCLAILLFNPLALLVWVMIVVIIVMGG